MSLSTVEKKLSQMILDKTISGVLDQGAGVLIVFEESLKDETYDAALSTVQKMDKVVDALFNKAKRLTYVLVGWVAFNLFLLSRAI